MSDRQNDVLAAIDGALDDWTVSGDAMRWSPSEGAKPATYEPSTRSFRMHTWEEYTRITGRPPNRPPNGTYTFSSRGSETTTEHSMWLLDSDFADLQPGNTTVTIQGPIGGDQ